MTETRPIDSRQPWVLLWASDPRGGNVTISENVRDIFGVTPDDIRGGRWLELLHPADRDHVSAVQHQARAHGEPFTIQFRMRMADGEYRKVVDTGLPMANGAYHGVCRPAESTPAPVPDLARVSHAPTGATAEWAIRWVGRVNEGHVSASCNVADILGVTPAETAEDGWMDFIHPEDREHFFAGLFAAFARRQPYTLSFRLRVRGGGYVRCTDTGTPMSDGSFHGLVRPVTDGDLALPPPPARSFVSLRCAAERVGLSVDTLRRLARKPGQRWAHRAGRKLTVDLANLIETLRAN